MTKCTNAIVLLLSDNLVDFFKLYSTFVDSFYMKNNVKKLMENVYCVKTYFICTEKW